MQIRTWIADRLSRLLQDFERASDRRQRLAAIAAAALLITVCAILFEWQSGSPASAQTPAASTPRIPVQLAYVRRADVPIYLEGLGTVQAFNTVTVNSRVDGQVQSVFFAEGQQVKAGDALVQIDPRPFQAAYDQAVARVAQDQAQLTVASLTDSRYAALVRANALALELADTQHALVLQLRATVRGDQGAVDAAKVQLDYTKIVSPIDGITGIRLVDAGNIVHATDTTGLVVVTQLQPISVVFTLPEEDLAQAAQALAHGPATVAALSRDGKIELDRGTVLLVDNEINQATGTIRLKATFSNPHRTLWPGQFVTVRMLIQTRHNVLTVPSAAVERGPSGLFTYLVGSGGAVAMREIDVGQDNGTIAIVTGGLSDGDRVVTAGQYRIQPGDLVQVNGGKRQVRTAARGTLPPALQ